MCPCWYLVMTWTGINPSSLSHFKETSQPSFLFCLIFRFDYSVIGFLRGSIAFYWSWRALFWTLRELFSWNSESCSFWRLSFWYSVLIKYVEGSCSHELCWHFVPGDDITPLGENPAVLYESFSCEGSGYVHVDNDSLLEACCSGDGDVGSARQLEQKISRILAEMLPFVNHLELLFYNIANSTDENTTEPYASIAPSHSCTVSSSAEIASKWVSL